jgi:hypothetical protein
MDDVVGLIMVQIISNLKSGITAISSTTVVRPVFVSLAFATVVPLCCRFLVLPGWSWLESNNTLRLLKDVLRRRGVPFVVHTSLLLAFVTGASYAGTSNLFAAYLAGALISWWDTVAAPLNGQRPPSPALAADTPLQDNVPRNCAGPGQGERAEAIQQDRKFEVRSEGSLARNPISETPVSNRAPSLARKMPSKATQTIPETVGLTLNVTSRTGVAVYEQYYLAPVDKIFKPLFFVRTI